MIHLMGGQRDRRPIAGSPVLRTVQPVGRFQVIEFATLLSTLLALPPTVRIDAMAATAISDAISVYSIAVAPSAFFIRRRKIDSIGISKISKIGGTSATWAWELKSQSARQTAESSGMMRAPLGSGPNSTAPLQVTKRT